MFVLLFIAVLLVVLFVFKQKVETFTNNNIYNGGENKPQVNKVTKKANKYGDEIYQCEGGPYKIDHAPYRSKYDSTTCIPCQNPPICGDHSIKCMNENTFYNTLDNCVEDGNCRLVEDELNMLPIKTNCLEKS